MINKSFEELALLNPYKGVNREYDLVRHRTKDSKINYYLLESWITGEPDKWYTSNAGQLRIKLKNFGLTCQEWYDMSVLGFTSKYQRPRCKACGKEVEFSLCFGYRPYCSKSCQAKGTMTKEKSNKMHESWKNLLSIESIRSEFSEKQRVRQTGMKRSKESIRKSIDTRIKNGNNKLSPESREIISRKNKERYKNDLDNIDRLLNVGYHRTKTGEYSSNKCSYPIKYLSSWELDFMKLCESLSYVTKIEKGLKFRYLNTKISSYKIYVSDFTITTINNEIYVIEIKPYCFINKQMVTDKRNSAISECFKLGYKYITLTQFDLYTDEKKSLNYSLSLSEEYKNQYVDGVWIYNKTNYLTK